jgi:hypothetical protein
LFLSPSNSVPQLKIKKNGSRMLDAGSWMPEVFLVKNRVEGVMIK